MVYYKVNRLVDIDMSRKIQKLKKIFIPIFLLGIIIFQSSANAYALNSGTENPATVYPITLIAASNPPSTGTCNSSGGPLAWMICAVINVVSDGEVAIEHVIDSLLQTTPLVFNNQQWLKSHPHICESSTKPKTRSMKTSYHYIVEEYL